MTAEHRSIFKPYTLPSSYKRVDAKLLSVSTSKAVNIGVKLKEFYWYKNVR